MTWPPNLDELTAAEVVHRNLTTLPSETTVGDLREYFAASDSRRLAVITDGSRYVGSITPGSLPERADDAALASGFASHEPTLGPEATAAEARTRGLREPSRRIAVVDDAGTLLGIVAITRGLDGFCGSPDADSA